jgi:26S proteasome regulatory subunit N12
MSLDTLHKNLLAEWAKSANRDLQKIGELLKQIKQELTNEDTVEKLSPAAATAIHKDYFEINALYSVVSNDMKSFEKAITDVHSFYACQSEESVQKYLMYGLHLMYLLAHSELSEFHILLEQIDQSVQQINPYISTPVKIEQSLMEGAYNKVILNDKSVPSPYYVVFVKILMDTVRKEIAVCMEKSFKRLLLKDAAQMLLFESENDVNAFAQARGWKLEKDVFRFDLGQMQGETPAKHTLDTKRIALQNIFYAKQLEMIV